MILLSPVAFNLKESFRVRVEFWGLCSAAGALTWAASLAGFAAALGWAFELASHFRLQYAIILAFLAVAFACRRAAIPAGWFGLGASMNLLVIAPYLVPVQQFPPPQTAGSQLRILLLNVHSTNTRHDQVLEFVHAHAPDLVGLLEINDRWLEALNPLRLQYPHLVAEPRDDNFGIALYSRLPLAEGRIVYWGQAGLPSIRARLLGSHLAVNEFSPMLLLTHPLPPSNPEQFRLRNEQLEALATTASEPDHPVILLGDLNVTPWSPYFRQLLRRTQLRDSARGHGLRGTWPAQFPPLRIPIDHCLVSRGVEVIDRQVGPALGSDHLPLRVTLRLPDSRAPDIPRGVVQPQYTPEAQR
jgi:endonuclease/exonuclease/phosphatase (EEP) superfamily protein YafD